MSQQPDTTFVGALEHAARVQEERGYPPMPDEWGGWPLDTIAGMAEELPHDDRSITGRSVVAGAFWNATTNSAWLVESEDVEGAYQVDHCFDRWRHYLNRRQATDISGREDLLWEIGTAGQANDIARVSGLCDELVHRHKSDSTAIEGAVWNLLLIGTALAEQSPVLWGGRTWFFDRNTPEVSADWSSWVMWKAVARGCIVHSPRFQVQDTDVSLAPVPQTLLKKLDLWLSLSDEPREPGGVFDAARTFVAFHTAVCDRAPRRFEEAATLLEAAVSRITIGKLQLVVHQAAAACWFNAAMYEKAARSLELALTIAPTDSVLHLLRTKCFYECADSERMFLAFERYVRDAAPIASDFLSTMTLDLGLRLVETEKAAAEFRATLKRLPRYEERTKLVDSLRSEYAELSTNSRDFWYSAAISFLWEDFDQTPRRWGHVAMDAGEAVNAELKARLFNDVGEALGPMPPDPQTRALWKNVRASKGSLGQHLHFLSPEWLGSPAGAILSERLRLRFPEFHRDLNRFRELASRANNRRNPGAHETTSPEQAREAFQVAGELLAMLVRTCRRRARS